MIIITTDRIKEEIISATVDTDQKRVAEQWLQTFIHNSQNDLATNIVKCVFSCIAQGDFQTRSRLNKNPQFAAPNEHLKSIDYLSHASRIIIDYSQLSDFEELLGYFPTDHPAVSPRSSTHAVIRQKDNTPIELKGLFFGIRSQFPSLMVEPRDYGINIAIGGEGQKNYIGNKISSNGFSGHLLVHHNKSEKLLLVGLEQTTPLVHLQEVLWSNEIIHGEQVVEDQFGQTHSLTGASDTFTAAGSLYFSDPVYQAKLLSEKHAAPPEKYGGMQVTLNDENWPEIQLAITNINALIAGNQWDKLRAFLLEIPKSAKASTKTVANFISIDFSDYFKKITTLLGTDTKTTAYFEHIKNQETLLALIVDIQLGESQKIEDLYSLISKITHDLSLPENYRKAILRLQTLFMLQQNEDSRLTCDYNKIAISIRLEKTSVFFEEVETYAISLQNFYSSPNITPDEVLESFLKQTESVLKSLKKVKEKLKSLLENEEETTDVHLSSSWVQIKPKDKIKELDQINDALKTAKETLKKPPKVTLARTERLDTIYYYRKQKLKEEIDSLKLKKLVKLRILNNKLAIISERINIISPLKGYLEKTRKHEIFSVKAKNTVSHTCLESFLNQISDEITSFLNTPSSNAIQTLKETCLIHIENALSILETIQPGWTRYLTNSFSHTENARRTVKELEGILASLPLTTPPLPSPPSVRISSKTLN